MSLINFNLLSNYHTMLKTYLKKTTYVHPETHPASMIVQDQFNKFVTSTQIERWNNKLDADANAVSASKLSKPVTINGVEFDGSKNIEIKTQSINFYEIYLTLEKNNSIINIPDEYEFQDNFCIMLFINGIKLINKKHYNINFELKKINLVESYSNDSEVEIIIFK
jgi:hypothetical protein